MKVKFLDLGAQHAPLQDELQQVFARVLANNSFILGREVEQFETAFASYLGSAHCAAVSSGTAALHLALHALGIGPGDEVITVPNTFIATAEAICAVGARPIFVDVDPVSYTMDPGRIEDVITSRTRALIPVHLFGQPADLDPIMEIADKNGLHVIEDACQAHGALYKGRKAGSIATMGCFSFYPGKNLGCCGEGGAVVTNDPKLQERVRMLRDHGSARKYEHQYSGYNFRMEGIQGGVLAVKLPHLDGWNDKRIAIAHQYEQLLRGTGVITPATMPFAKHVFHLYVVQTEGRDAVRQALTDRGIDTGMHYPTPLHLTEAFRSLGYRRGSFPVAEAFAERIISLPMFPQLKAEEVEYVAHNLQEIRQCRLAQTTTA